jgi:beta-glucosidase
MLENVFLRATTDDDFVGVQCYTRMHFGPEGVAPNDPEVPLTLMGDERWPQAVEHTVRRAASVSGRPVVVTENGIATDDDAERIAFVRDALVSAHRCIEEGIDLRGYFVWSLLDNFEWHLGYGPKFGIAAVTPDTFERRPKPSAYWFGEVARANAVVPAGTAGPHGEHSTPE